MTSWSSVSRMRDSNTKKLSEGVWLTEASFVDFYIDRWECDEGLFGFGGRRCTYAERENKLRKRFLNDLKGFSAYKPEMDLLPVQNLGTPCFTFNRS